MTSRQITASEALRRHWPEYVMEAAELASFLSAACAASLLLFHPASPATQLVPAPLVRRMLMGLMMAATGAMIVYSPWGKQSGAHFNPAVTLTFWRLDRVATWDAVLYAFAQFLGGVVGAAVAAIVAGPWLSDAAVRFAATTPGRAGAFVAWVVELALAFGLMLTVLIASNSPRLAKFTGLLTAGLVAIYIPVAAPISGMSMNPARTLASAVPANIWTGLWIYFTAPPLAMLLAAESYVRVCGPDRVFCAKFHHDNSRRCIFCETRIVPLTEVRNDEVVDASNPAATIEMPVNVTV